TRRLDGDWYVQPPPSGPSPLTGALAGVAWDSLPPATSLVELAGGSESHATPRSEEHTSELQSRGHLVCRLLLEKKTAVGIFYDPAALLTFMRFNFVLRRTLLALMNMNYIAIRNLLSQIKCSNMLIVHCHHLRIS